jgi:hypothetical protein
VKTKVASDAAETEIETEEKVTIDHETGEVIAEGDELPGSMSETDPVQQVAKLTIADIGGNPSMAKIRSQRVPVAVFAGRVLDTKQVEHPTKPGLMFTALTGAFSAINLQTGAEYKSGVLYLPEAFQSYLVAALEHSRTAPRRRSMSAFRGIEFTYKIDAKPASNPSGYSYVLQSLQKAHAPDPTSHLVANAKRLLGIEANGMLQLPGA